VTETEKGSIRRYPVLKTTETGKPISTGEVRWSSQTGNVCYFPKGVGVINGENIGQTLFGNLAVDMAHDYVRQTGGILQLPRRRHYH
jgi:hypothetical protein